MELVKKRDKSLLALVLISIIFLCVILSTLVVPSLIESAYRGESLSIFNGLISGQANHPLEHYLKVWNKLAVLSLYLLVVVSVLVFVVGPANLTKRGWNTYWYRPAPLVHLAICRIVIVAFQLYILTRIGHYDYFLILSELPDFVYDPLPVLHLLIWPFGWTYRPSFEIFQIVRWATLVAGVLALIGLRTNASLIIFAVGNLFMQALGSSFGDFHHSRGLAVIALSILALGPAGRVLSIDDLWRRLRVNSEKRRFEVFNIMDENSAFARWPLLLIQWMFALIYLSAATSKLGKAGLDWVNGYTLQYYLLEDGLRWGSDIGVWLGQHHTVVWLLSWMTTLFEGTFFLVLLFPMLALIYIPMGVAFHTGIYLTMKAPFLVWFAIYSVFIPWVPIFKTLSHRMGFLQRAKKPELLFDGQCPLCIRSMTLLRYFDWFDRLAFADLDTQWQSLAKRHPGISLEDCRREMHLLLPGGSVQKGFFAFRKILGYLPLFWPLVLVFYFPLASAIGPKLYRLVASRRLRYEKCNPGSCSFHSGRTESS